MVKDFSLSSMNDDSKHHNKDKIQYLFPSKTLIRFRQITPRLFFSLIRPILMGNAMDPDLIQLCAEFATNACEDISSQMMQTVTNLIAAVSRDYAER